MKLLYFLSISIAVLSQDKKSIARHIYQLYLDTSIEEAILSYKELKNNKMYRYHEDELNNMGYYLLKQDKLKDALKIFLLNTKEYPETANVYDSYAEALTINKQYQKAEKNYLKALKLSKYNHEFMERLANFYRERKNKDAELKTWEKLTVRNPDKAEYHDLLINSHYFYGNKKKARQLYSRFKKNFPKFNFAKSRLYLVKDGQLTDRDSKEWQYDISRSNKNILRKLENKIYDRSFKNINGLLVISGMKILYENYFNGSDLYALHDTRSVGKSFASALLGIAIDDGHIKSEKQLLSDFYNLESYENYNPEKKKISLEDLLTMRSAFEGFDFDPNSIGNEENMYPKDNWVKWTLNLPMAKDRKPGEKWYYFTAGAVLLGDLINKSVPEGLEKYAKKKLLTPLNIKNYKWLYTPQNVPSTAGGFRLSARDLAKFGLLYKNNGSWKGKQLLSKNWVKKSLMNYSPTTVKNNNYGYLFWKKTYRVQNKDFPLSYASGNGGNKVFIFDKENLVIVVTASAYGQSYMHSQVDKIMENYLIPAFLKK